MPVAGVVEHLVERGLRGAQIASADDHLLQLDVGEHHLPALVARSDEVLLRHQGVVEEDLVGAQDVPCKRRRPAHLDALGRGIDEQQADAAVLGLAGPGPHIRGDGRVGQAATRAPGLLATDEEVVPVVLGGGAQCRGVGAAVRLAEADGETVAARHHLLAYEVALRLAAPPEHRDAGDEHPDVAHGHVEAGPSELLGDQDELQRAASVTALVLGEREREPPQLGHTAKELGRYDPLLVPLLGLLGRAHVGHELPSRRTQQVLLIGQPEVHGHSSPALGYSSI